MESLEAERGMQETDVGGGCGAKR